MAPTLLDRALVSERRSSYTDEREQIVATLERSDGWVTGDSYEAYMGRWSRPLARSFVAWLSPKPFAHWLDVGCGTGALTSAVVDLAQPSSIVGCDPSRPFVEYARESCRDERTSFVVASAESLPHRDGEFDALVSGLVLNFLPDAKNAVAAMRERARPGGTIGAYVWDYAEGMQFLRYFWDEATALDARATALDEGLRFPLCQPAALGSLFRTAGLTCVETHALQISTDFSTFDDYWAPFLQGTGPAPSYVASLGPAEREALRERLQRRLQGAGLEPIRLHARAWAVRAVVSDS